MQLASSLKTSTPCRCHGSHGSHGSQDVSGCLRDPGGTYGLWLPTSTSIAIITCGHLGLPGKQSELDGTPVPIPCFPTVSSFR